MAETNIIGRIPQRRILQQAMDSSESEFIAVYGRRRIGKTFLIREFFEKNIRFEMIGIYNASLGEQLENFAEALGRYIGVGIPLKTPRNWREAFQQLEALIAAKGNSRSKGKHVLFLDELPWLNTPRSKFMPALQHFWNSFCSKRKDIVLVVCGSAASWMIQNVVRSRGGLHNRLTRQFRLLPFTLAETSQYLQSRSIKSLDHYAITQIYMAVGGVPYYLSKIEKGKSAAQVIDALCFADSAPLRFEYDLLYRSLFESSDQHIKIVETLSKTRKGFTRNELLNKTGLKSGGSATQILEELQESGFIESRIPFGKKSNDALYRLIDEFTLFHLYWIKPLGKTNPDPGYWLTRQQSSRYKTWIGFSFENICLKHIAELKRALGIAAIYTEECPWRFVPGSTSEQTGAQIDLLIDRADHTINLCEMKFYNAEFRIDAKYAKELRNKVSVFKEQTGTRKTIFITLITVFGILENKHSTSLETLEIKIEDLFK
jgi:hypothetical protein